MQDIVIVVSFFVALTAALRYGPRAIERSASLVQRLRWARDPLRGADLAEDSFESLTIRRARGDDMTALQELAALDSRPLPAYPLLIAEEDGTMIAALSLSEGRVVADPFRATSSAVALLELRAAQLSRRKPARIARGLDRRLPAPS
jgi:hypothetical protein